MPSTWNGNQSDLLHRRILGMIASAATLRGANLDDGYRDIVALDAGPGLQPVAGHTTTAVRLAPRRHSREAVCGSSNDPEAAVGTGL